jgi:hypothetical protein
VILEERSEMNLPSGFAPKPQTQFYSPGVNPRIIDKMKSVESNFSQFSHYECSIPTIFKGGRITTGAPQIFESPTAPKQSPEFQQRFQNLNIGHYEKGGGSSYATQPIRPHPSEGSPYTFPQETLLRYTHQPQPQCQKSPPQYSTNPGMNIRKRSDIIRKNSDSMTYYDHPTQSQLQSLQQVPQHSLHSLHHQPEHPQQQQNIGMLRKQQMVGKAISLGEIAEISEDTHYHRPITPNTNLTASPNLSHALWHDEHPHNHTWKSKFKTQLNEDYILALIHQFENSKHDYNILSDYIFNLAISQTGSRFLQKELTKANPPFIQFILKQVFCSFYSFFNFLFL